MLRIRNWAKFQHYKDRNPPWIKLHVEILSSEDWVTLDDASKLLAIACMVIAAKHDGEVPDNPGYIKRVAYLEQLPNLEPLIECGFFEKPQADASAMLADARPEKETQDRKQKAETEKKEQDRASRVVTPVEPPSTPPVEAKPIDLMAALREAVKPAKPKRKARTSLPENFPDDDAMTDALQFWRVHARFDLQPVEEMIKFRAHHTAHGKTMADWPAAWRTWFHNALQFNRPEHVNGRRESPLEQSERIARDLIREDSGNEGANSGADRVPRVAVRPPSDERYGASDMARNLLRGPEGEDR